MNFWIAGSALTALTTLALVVPAWRARSRTEFAGREQSVYVDQLSELDRDAKVGLISGTNAVAARTEIKRRMLKASRRMTSRQDGGRRGGKWVFLVAALVVPAIGVATYIKLGNPDMASVPFADRAGERASAQEFRTLIERLRARLLSDTELRAEGWTMLARSYMETGQPEKAVWAMETLIKRGGARIDPELYAYYAEILIQADDGIVSPKAEAALETALAAQPDNVAAIFYKAISYEQSGDLQRAYTLLRDRVEKELVYKPWMDAVAGRANALAQRIGAAPVVVPQAGPGPNAADIAAAGQMSAADRQAFVRSMVERLASRLATQPDDLDGWIRLGNAYRVLGETDKAGDAFRKAEKLAANLPRDDPRRGVIAEALAGQ